MSKKIPLAAWGALHYAPPPSLRTLRAWVRAGRIHPAPELVGREYRVSEDAVYVPAGAPLTAPPQGADAVVAAIWSRQA